MRSAEGVAAIEQVLLVGDVGADKPHREALAEVLTNRKVEGVIGRKVVGAITVEEAGAIVEFQ